MHRVESRLRIIKPADLPKVRGLDGKERKATPDELLNLGIVARPEVPNLYDCREQEQTENGVAWVPLVTVEGEVLASGEVQHRHDKLPAKIKVDLWRARVPKSVGRGKKKRTELVEVDVSQIKQTDVVESAGVKKHRWDGERER